VTGPWTRWRVAAVLGVVVLLAAVSILQTGHQRPGTDFHARWLAGRWFFEGAPLYRDLPDVREPSYPPFAAMVFQVFAAFPLRVAAAGFYFANLLLTGATVVLTRRIFQRLWPDRGRTWWPLAGAVMLSAQFLLNNLNLVQVNTALFALCLWGVLAYSEERDARAATAFVVATFIKVIPVFFLAWLVLRGRRRAVLAIGPVALACLALPMVQRGVTGGVRDLTEYYHTFLENFRAGVPPRYNRYTNQSLGAAVVRLMRPPAVPEERDYRIIDASEGAARATTRVATIAIGVAFLANLLLLRRRKAPITVFEWSSVFLVGHLLSGITWKAHLVTLLFVFCAFLSLRAQALPRGGWRVLLYGALALMIVSGLTGRDLVGDRMHHWIGGYSLLTWTMVVLFAAAVALCQRFATAPEPSPAVV
jgi:hypothetical protein